MPCDDIVMLIDTNDIINELKRRFPLGMVAAFVSESHGGVELFYRSGLKSVQIGLTNRLAHHVSRCIDDESVNLDDFEFDSDDELV